MAKVVTMMYLQNSHLFEDISGFFESVNDFNESTSELSVQLRPERHFSFDITTYYRQVFYWVNAFL
jgi:hypothetical protein